MKTGICIGSSMAILAGFLLPISAFADDIAQTWPIKANSVATTIAELNSYNNKTCAYIGTPVIDIVSVESGTARVSVENVAVRASGYVRGPGAEFKPCVGRSYPSAVLRYTPVRGFTGKARIVYRIAWPDGNRDTVTITADVKASANKAR